MALGESGGEGSFSLTETESVDLLSSTPVHYLLKINGINAFAMPDFVLLDVNAHS